jgi:DNA-binding beta-propeller fold protein YncE
MRQAAAESQAAVASPARRTFFSPAVSEGQSPGGAAQVIAPERRPAVRRNHAILLAILIAGCSPGTEPTRSANAVATSPAAPTPTAVATSTPATTAEPDWSTLKRLDSLVTATVDFPEEWPRLSLATFARSDFWWPNGNEGGPPAVARIDPDTMELIEVIELGGEKDVFPPDAWGTAPSKDGVWVPLAYQHAVALIDPRTNTVSRRLEVDATPYSVVESGDDLWIADWENSAVVAIDRSTGDERLRVDGIAEPTQIANGPEGLWVNEHAGDEIVRLDPATGDELARVVIGGRPGMVLGLGSVWALSDDDRLVSRIDPATNLVVATIPMAGNPTGGVIAAGAVWITGGPQRGSCERTSFLVRIDPTSNAVDGILVQSCPFGLLSDGTRIWIGSVEGDRASMHRLEPG